MHKKVYFMKNRDCGLMFRINSPFQQIIADGRAFICELFSLLFCAGLGRRKRRM